MTTSCGDCGRNYATDEWCGATPCPSDDCPSHHHPLAPETLDALYNADGDGEHPTYPRRQWREQVAGEFTLTGYWAWVSHMLTNE